MMATTMRSADPAAYAPVDADSSSADEMLRKILSTPRLDPVRRRRRLVLGAAVGVAAAAAVAVPVVLADSGSSAGSAYAVERKGDGSVEVTIQFDQFADSRKLQRALDEKHVKAVVIAGPAAKIGLGADGKVLDKVVMPSCGKFTPYDSGKPQGAPEQPILDIDSPRFDRTGLRLRPDLLPASGTFVIGITTSGRDVVGISGEVAIGTPPSCPPWFVVRDGAGGR